jgi:hypothetical protein
MDERGGTHPVNSRTTFPARRAPQEVRRKGRERIGWFTDHPLDEEVLS